MDLYKILFSLFLIFSNCFWGQNQDSLTKNIEQVVLKKTTKKYKNKKENPAYNILNQLWKKKKNPSLDKFNSYTFNEYEKIEYTINNLDSTFTQLKIFNQMDFIFKYGDSVQNGKISLPFLLNEAYYKIYGKNKPQKKYKKEIIAQKTSGFQDNEMVSLFAKNLFKETDIFSNTINFFNIGFQSPISSTGFSTFDYNLLENSIIDGIECYKISYEPKIKEALAFRGHIFISKEKYDLVKLTLRSPKGMNLNFVNSIVVDYEFFSPNDDDFFIQKIDSEFEIKASKKNKDAKSITAKRTLVYSDYILNPEIEDKTFKIKEIKSAQALAQSDEVWQKIRKDSLSKREKGIYEMLDKLNEVPKFNQIINLYETLATGYHNIEKKIDLGSLYSIFGYNHTEGARVQFGARTFFSQNDMWRIQGYGAYGFKDQQFKYALEGKIMFNPTHRFQIGAGHRRDILQAGSQLMGNTEYFSSTASYNLFTRGENTSLTDNNSAKIFTSIEPIRNIEVRLEGVWQHIRSAHPDFNINYFLDNKLRKALSDTHISLSIKAKPLAKYSKIGIDRREHASLTPTILIKYTKGLKNIFLSDFNYDKIQLLYSHPILVGNWGKSVVNFEAGKNFSPLPIALQNIIPANQSYSLTPNTFAQLNFYEFVADSYATLHWEHHFNGKFLSLIPLIKKLKLREIGIFRAAYGTLSSASKQINWDKRFSAPDEQIYYEYGFGIENIGFSNFRIFRVDFNWRGNYLNRPNVQKFGVKFGMKFNF